MKRFLPFSILTIICIFFNQKLNSQTLNPCGTPKEKSEWLRYYQSHLEEFPQRNDDTSWIYVPMTIHILGNDDGTGYFPPDNAFFALCELNEDFAPSRIRYYLKQNFNYINKTEWYEHLEFGPGGQMMLQNNVSKCLNSYIVSNPAGNCGYYWGQFDGLALSKSCISPGDNTWAHELGHNLSLPHPFFGWEGHNDYNYSKPAPTDWDGWPVEKMDGSNCQFAADGFCDTPPDYLNYRWDCNSDGISYVTQHDPDTIPFKSDGSFYMSYSLDKCANRFSNEQTKAMRTNLKTERADILTITQAGPDLSSVATAQVISPINNEEVQYNDAQLVWEPVPGAEFYHVTVTLWNVPGAKFYSVMVPATQTSVDVSINLPLNKEFRWQATPYSSWDFCKPDSVIWGKFKTINTVAINDLERVATAQILPNPASGSFAQMKLESSENFKGRLEIIDFSGKMLFKSPETVIFEGENLIAIPIFDLPAGVYSVNFSSEKGRITRKLVISE
jgi:hypothetical protein